MGYFNNGNSSPNNKLPGHALAITIVIGLVLSILVTSLILIGYYNRNNAVDFNRKNIVSVAMQSGINYVLSGTVPAAEGSVHSLELPNKGINRTGITTYAWGLFEVAAVKVESGSLHKEKVFFYGEQLPPVMDAAIYLAEHQRSLLVVGNTTVTGDVMVSKAGVKRGSISGNSYNKPYLIDGAIKESKSSLPEVAPSVLSHISRLQKGDFIAEARSIVPGDSLTHSFAQTPVIIKKRSPLYLDQVSLRGRIIIQSETSIEVSGNATLENIILIAPVVRIKKFFQGTVQVFAQDSLIVEDGCRLNYPSALVLLKEKTNHRQALIKVGKDCSFSGTVLSISPGSDEQKAALRVNENTFLEGVFYVHGYVWLKGNLTGCVLTDYFMHETPVGVYENYLVDVKINRRELPDFYTVPSCFGPAGIKRIVQWVE
jgi:hypothetical protein